MIPHTPIHKRVHPQRSFAPWLGIVTVSLIIAHLFVPNPARAQAIGNKSVFSPPFWGTTTPTSRLGTDGCSWNIYAARFHNTADPSGRLEMMLQGTINNSLLCSFGTFAAETLYASCGFLRLGQCGRAGSFTVQYYGKLDGLVRVVGGAPLAVQQAIGAIQLTMRNPYDLSVIYTGERQLFNETYWPGTGRVFDNLAVTQLFSDVSLPAGLVIWEFRLAATLIVQSAPPLGVIPLDVIQLAPRPADPLFADPAIYRDNGGFQLDSLVFTDNAPDQTPPTTDTSTAAIPCGQRVTLTATDNAGGYGVADIFYRVVPSEVAFRRYTGPFDVVGFAWGVEFYAVDAAGNTEPVHSIGLSIPAPPYGPFVTCAPGFDHITLQWSPVAGATGYRVYREGVLMTNTSDTNWTDHSPGGGTRCYSVTCTDACGEGEPQTPVCASVIPPSVRLLSGTLNGIAVSLGALEVTVQAGDPISGAVTVEAGNGAVDCVAPLVAAWGWGNHASSFTTVHSRLPVGGTLHNVPLNLVAPETPGEYYISFAYGLEYTGAQVASLTNWQRDAGNPHWNDGHDIADWGANEYAQAMSQYQVTTLYEGPSGWQDATLPAAMVKIIVTPKPSYVTLYGGALNDAVVSGGVLEITVDACAPITGQIGVEAYIPPPPGNIAPLVAVWGWGEHSTAFTLVAPWLPVGMSQYNVPLNLQAPSTPGEYYISFAFAMEITGAQVASLTNWQADAGNPHWNDGHDIADWGAAEYMRLISEHQVTTQYEGPAGWHDATLPAAMIKVTVVDVTPPAIVCKADTIVECASATGTLVEFTAQATDACGQPVDVTFEPPSGSPFPPGGTKVTCSASDLAGNSSVCSFFVIVDDKTPPLITCPSEIRVESTSPDGMAVDFAVPVSDLCDESPAVVLVPPPGTVFPLGSHEIACAATDDADNQSSCTFQVTVFDGTPPVITLPAEIVVECVSRDGAPVPFDVLVADACDLNPTVTCNPAPGAVFPIGVTEVAVTATDASGNVSSGTLRVTVIEGRGSVGGRVITSCADGGTPLGVHVDAYDAQGTLAGSTSATPDGSYSIADLPSGAPYTVTIVPPLGYSAAVDELPAEVWCAETTAMDFEITCIEIAAQPRGIGFWKHQVGVALGGNGAAEISGPELCALLDLIESHFNSNAINPVAIYAPPAGATDYDKLLVAKELLNLKGDVAAKDRAAQQLTALLLNVAAGYISLRQIVSEDSATVSQAITYCDRLIDDPSGRHELAKTICDDINNNRIISAAVIPLSTEDIAYKQLPGGFVLAQNYPNPFNPTTYIDFTLVEPSHAELTLYNALGQPVARLVNGFLRAGRHAVAWNGCDDQGIPMPSGLYLYRLQTPHGAQVKRMLLLK